MNIRAAIVVGFIVLGEAHHYYYVMRLGFKQHYSTRPSNTGIYEELCNRTAISVGFVEYYISAADLNS